MSSLSQISKEDSGTNSKFFKRLSSIKVDYEKDNRRTVQSFIASNRNSKAVFLREKEEVHKFLRATLSEDDRKELYIEVFCLLYPSVKSREHPDSNALTTFLQKIFFLDPTTHKKLIADANTKKLGERILHLEVVEAKNLPAKDLNGFSDPFCTLYVTSKECSKRTKVIQKNLNPVWNETFKFKVMEPSTDFLRIEVWDHDPEERMRDKLKRLGDIRSPWAIGNFVRELAHGHDSAQEFIGNFSIPIKEISSETMEKWCPLGYTEQEGEIYLRMGLGVDKERTEAVTGYRMLLQLLIIHELEKGPVMVPFHWENTFDPWAEYLLRQLHTGWALTQKDILLAKWIAYNKLHRVFPLSGRIMPPLIFEVFDSVGKFEFNTHDISLILGSAKELVGFSVSFVEKIHEFFACMVTTSQLYYVLKAIDLLGKSIDRIKLNAVGQRVEGTTHDIGGKSIVSEMQSAIRRAAKTSMWRIIETSQNTEKKEDSNSEELKNDTQTRFLIEAKKLLRVGQLLIDDLEKGLSVVDKDFKMIIGVDYHQITYEFYDIEYEKMVKPFISQFCTCLKLLCGAQYGKSNTDFNDSTQSVATSHFVKLYLCLKKFAELAPAGSRDPSGTQLQWRIQNTFHNWFFPGIGYMLDLLGQVWMGWMSKAVETDSMTENVVLYPEEETATVTSSAVDSVQIFTQIQTFWNTLSWPDPKQSIIFAERLLKELCGYSIFYSNLVANNLEKNERSRMETGQLYYTTDRLCRCINNIDYVGVYTREIAVQLNLQQILSEVQNNSTEISLMDKQVEIQKSGLEGVILDILKSAGTRIETTLLTQLSQLLDAKAKKNDNKYESTINELLDYIGTNLTTLENNLLPVYFLNAINTIWEAILRVIKHLIAVGLQDKKTWEHFAELQSILDILMPFLEQAYFQHSASYCKKGSSPLTLASTRFYKEVQGDLNNYSVSVSQLKIRYYDSRQTRQKACKGDRGFICVRALYQKKSESLVVEILSARKVPAVDSNGLSDPYVHLRLVPAEEFPGVATHTTKVVKENLYPIFEEVFVIKLRQESFTSGGYLNFQVFDYDFITKNRLLGEVVYPLKDISVDNYDEKNVSDLPQQLLPLTLPNGDDISFIRGLSHNRNDKEMVRFCSIEAENRQS